MLHRKSLREAAGTEVRSQRACGMLLKRAPGSLPPRNGIWHLANKAEKVQEAACLIKDAFSAGFYFRAHSISCYVESK